MFSEQEIRDTYTSIVKLPNSYFRKYERLPPCPVQRYGYVWGNYDFPRNWCILDFKEWMLKYGIHSVDNLGYTSDTDPELEFLQYKRASFVPYPEHDLHTISKTFQEVFDFFIFSQTLEHLYNPFLAVKNIYDIMKPGGFVFTSVPTLNIPHMTPIHFNGFTPMGLAMLFKYAGFEIMEIGQWGNQEYIQRLWATHSWLGYNELHKSGIVVNEERNVCQCWILARKPVQINTTSNKSLY